MNAQWMTTGTCLLLASLSLLTTSLPRRVVGQQAVDGGRCLTCDDLNRQGNGQCIYSYDQCGDCKPGFIRDEADPKLCYKLELIRSPSSVTSEAGVSIELRCVFNGPVECQWTKDGQLIAVQGGQSRYEYVVDMTSEEDEGRRDCSLRIPSLTHDDAGQWTCGSPPNSLRSKPFQISITTTRKPTTAVHTEREWSEAEDETNMATQRPTVGINDRVQSTIGNTAFTTAIKSILWSIIVLLLMMVLLSSIGFGLGLWLKKRPERHARQGVASTWETNSLMDN